MGAEETAGGNSGSAEGPAGDSADGTTEDPTDGAGRTRISCPGCEAVKPFRNGRAPVVRGGRRLEIDREGREFDI